MIRAAGVWGATLAALPTAAVLANGMVQAPGSAWLAAGWGSGIAVLGVGLVIASSAGATMRTLLAGLLAGLSATTLAAVALALLAGQTGQAGPLAQIMALHIAYGTSAAVGACLIAAGGRARPAAYPVAAGAQGWSMMAVARLEHGAGGALLEQRLELMTVPLTIWAIATALAALMYARQR